MIHNNTAPFFEFTLFEDFSKELRHAIFTRDTDICDHAEVQKWLTAAHRPFSFTMQLHGTRSYVVKKQDLNHTIRDTQEGDVLITRQTGIPLVIRIADCASVLLYDPKKRVAANIHAGWRGHTQRVIHKTIQTMHDAYGCDSKDIYTGISPMLGPCCSHFSDPYNELPKFLHEYITEENTVNLWAITEAALMECGVPRAQIENPRVCTFCTPEHFYSYRRARGTPHQDRRFGTAIMLL